MCEGEDAAKGEHSAVERMDLSSLEGRGNPSDFRGGGFGRSEEKVPGSPGDSALAGLGIENARGARDRFQGAGGDV